MAKSMTGYGRAEQTLNGRTLAVEVKSVNARYFEYSSRMPRSMAFLDEHMKKTVAKSVSRGKVEVHLSVQAQQVADTKVTPDIKLALGYYNALLETARHLGLKDDLQASALLQFPDIFTLERAETDEDQLRADVLSVLGQALAAYDAMRSAEGAKLAEDVNSRLDALGQMVGEVEKDSAGRVQRHTDKLRQRLEEVLADHNVEESRLLTEAAIFADKTAVDEETVRLRSHLKQFREMVAKDGPVGRKLDFLTQEVNRETNTIGSKCQELDITRLVVDMKAEIEKIREQIQNLE